MQLGSLKVFCDIVRHRSFSKAAQANDITQSAASQIVSQLERRIEVQLIDRSVRPLELTPLGQTFYEGCKTLLQQYADLEERIRSAQATVAGAVQVAAIYSVGLGDMGQYVQRFTALQPKAQVYVEYLHPDRVYERVLDGTVDLGLVSFPRPTPNLVTLPWREEEMVVACSPQHPLARHLAIKPQDLDGQKFVHFERNLVIRRKVDRFLREHDIAVDIALEFDNIENIKQAVALDAGVALLPEPTLRREVKARTLVALPLFGCRLTRPLGIIHRRRQGLSNAARFFVDLLLDREPTWGASNGRPAEAATLDGADAHGNGHRTKERGRNGSQRTHKRKS